ncbi:MAG: glycoside hydrolase family 27 protein [Bdellovibrionia bacterium]
MQSLRFSWQVGFAFFLGFYSSFALGSPDPLIAATPPMGWNTWNYFGCEINEQMVKETAEAMTQSGMQEAGYRYVILDDCWQAKRRNDQGLLVADPVRFPSGIRALADWLHAKDFKLGIYTSVGFQTCKGYPGSFGHEREDAQQFIDWGVDFVKDDFCVREGFAWPWWNYYSHYKAMSDALKTSPHPIVFSLCNWGVGSSWKWASEISHMWRTTFDIRADWNSIMKIVDLQAGKEKFAGPGHWNDPDMLEVGNAPLTETESQAHFSLWSILASPLIAGNDIRSMSPQVAAILTQPEVIAVNQDPLGVQGKRVYDRSQIQVWLKPLKSNGFAVVILNRKTVTQSLDLRAELLGLAPEAYQVRDLWQRQDLGLLIGSMNFEVPAHGVRMLTLSLPASVSEPIE